MAKQKTLEEKQWLVENRTKIQGRMFELYKFISSGDAATVKELWTLAGTLIGVVFSLWRAVFLIEGERETEGEIEHGSMLLGILIDTNAIGFPQDRETAQWTAGYYVNNAALRLHAVTEMASVNDWLSSEAEEWLKYKLSPFDIDMMNLVMEHLRGQWEKSLEGYDLVYNDLQDAYERLQRHKGHRDE